MEALWKREKKKRKKGGREREDQRESQRVWKSVDRWEGGIRGWADRSGGG